ncbi:MAG: hypothetical protein JRI80_00070 [Deltaproteobacteria bacterium]|nr:hypothetical protein [Deltaproteobacteria bacterium]
MNKITQNGSLADRIRAVMADLGHDVELQEVMEQLKMSPDRQETVSTTLACLRSIPHEEDVPSHETLTRVEIYGKMRALLEEIETGTDPKKVARLGLRLRVLSKFYEMASGAGSGAGQKEKHVRAMKLSDLDNIPDYEAVG